MSDSFYQLYPTWDKVYFRGSARILSAVDENDRRENLTKQQMLYGLIATFAVDRRISIKTVKVTRDVYDKMLRQSLIYLLGWAQRTVLLSDRGFALKEKLTRGVSLNYEFNRYLISYYEMVDGSRRWPSLPISNDRGNYGAKDVCDAPLIVTQVDSDKYLVFVPIRHGALGPESEGHVDLIPLLSLYDV